MGRGRILRGGFAPWSENLRKVFAGHLGCDVGCLHFDSGTAQNWGRFKDLCTEVVANMRLCNSLAI